MKHAHSNELPIWRIPSLDMRFRQIPAGSFRMGSRGYSYDEEPPHEVRITEPFWLAETPVTQAQFALWTRSEKIEHKNSFEDHPDHPSETMDWRQAVRYCVWLTREKREELPDDGNFACLPTEAEWEYACRAHTDPACQCRWRGVPLGRW